MENQENQSQLSRHELKKLKRQQREEEEKKKLETQEKSKKRKGLIKYSIYAIIAIVVIFGLFKLFSGGSDSNNSSDSGPYTSSPVHWHASLDVYICGEKVTIPENAPLGEHHLGLPLLHTHADRLIHIEGQIWNKEEITIGKYMKVIGEEFTDTTLLDKNNGDLCNENPGKVKLIVNSKENQELTNYVVQDGDKLELRFE